MKYIKQITISTLTLTLFACGSGSTGGGSTPIEPASTKLTVGWCSSESQTFNPTIYANPHIMHATYINDGHNNLELGYSETESTPKFSMFSAAPSSSMSELPDGVCAMGYILENGDLKNFNGDVIYYTNCRATTTNLQMNFTATYGIYSPDQLPGNGSPLQSGSVNLNCTLKPF